MYRVRQTARFKKDLKNIIKRRFNIQLLKNVVDLLKDGTSLPVKNRDHALEGDYIGFRECHITPDWMLIYKIKADVLVLVLQRTGSHSDLY
jgi:mRNA interferase YafQ